MLKLPIFMFLLLSPCIYDHLHMYLLPYPCVYHLYVSTIFFSDCYYIFLFVYGHLFVNTIISMGPPTCLCPLTSPTIFCICYRLYWCTTISVGQLTFLCVYYHFFVSATISMGLLPCTYVIYPLHVGGDVGRLLVFVLDPVRKPVLGPVEEFFRFFCVQLNCQ